MGLWAWPTEWAWVFWISGIGIIRMHGYWWSARNRFIIVVVIGSEIERALSLILIRVFSADDSIITAGGL